MKIMRYLGIAMAIIAMIYAKTQMDAHNKAEIQSMDSIDQDDGTQPVKTKH